MRRPLVLALAQLVLGLVLVDQSSQLAQPSHPSLRPGVALRQNHRPRHQLQKPQGLARSRPWSPHHWLRWSPARHQLAIRPDAVAAGCRLDPRYLLMCHQAPTGYRPWAQQHRRQDWRQGVHCCLVRRRWRHHAGPRRTQLRPARVPQAALAVATTAVAASAMRGYCEASP